MSDDVVLAERDEGVLILTLNRPDRLNAWVPAMEPALFGALDDAATDPDVRVIVVTGAGRGFCPGADMDGLSNLTSGASFGSGGAGGRPAKTWPMNHALSIPKPVIGAINGACAGMGLALALSFDIRFTVPAAKFTTAFARRGLIAEHGLSWTLPRVCGLAVANDLLLSSRVITGEEALALGMVNRVIAPESLMAETLAYAKELAVHCSPASMAAMKQQVQRAIEQSPSEALAEADHLMRQTLKGPDFKEGVTSYVDKREPSFPPLGAGTELHWS